ncbi:MAG: phosphatidate cytidylyltransferase [Acidobacteria bacterium]|nr:MAG: phosphatidate cytidylyltransferase [Acidobacteriota bacterium]PYR82673.1 MAG: phosphatidate cytidylyltransferase [Acidobacteriota bacterium]
MTWFQLALLLLVVVFLPGCAVVGGIFKAGAWVGALAVILVIGIVAFVAAKIAG